MIALALVVLWAFAVALLRPGASRALSWLAVLFGTYITLRVCCWAGAQWAHGGGP